MNTENYLILNGSDVDSRRMNRYIQISLCTHGQSLGGKMAKKATGLTTRDYADIALIRKRMKEHQKARNKAEAQIKACYTELRAYEFECNHANGYKTSCMGDSGFTCPDCGYSY